MAQNDIGGATEAVGKGVLAGVTGTAAMTVAQKWLLPSGFFSKIPSGYEPSEPRYPAGRKEEKEPSTETVARRLVEGLAHRPLRGKEKRWAGNLVHFGTGAIWGGLFGLVAPRRPSIGKGLLWGTLVWAVNDNLVLPLFRVADWPRYYPIGIHLRALFAHLVYGAGTALALKLEGR